MAMHCCATLLVARDRVLLRPLEMYQALLQWLQTTVRLGFRLRGVVVRRTLGIEYNLNSY